MASDASIYAALGLEPGADASAIERAYKSLIKQHHPDREGGDSARAAEINRAYRELRSESGHRNALTFHDEEPADDAGGGWVRAAVALLLALAVLLALTGPLPATMRQLLQPQAQAEARAMPASEAVGRDPMDQPLNFLAMSEGVREAQTMLGRSGDGALAGASRDCHRALRLDPSVAQLDRCAAFDDAVVQLQDRDPMWDQGPFSQIAVTGRQWSGASALSGDYLAIDSRLERIRLQVELALAPTIANVASPPRPDPLPREERGKVTAAR